MRSAVLQFLLAGALVVAWIWMLGRPLLTMLARRSRRDSVGHFRYQQAALGRTVGLDPPDGMRSFVLFRPIAEWRAQPRERRRLQLLLGFALATFASALLAIALRGTFIRLFLIMTIGLTAHVLVAAWIGARELRAREAELRRRSIDAAAMRSVGRAVTADGVERGVARDQDMVDDDPYDMDDLLTGDGLGGGLFDDGFFEPIPELDPATAERSGAAGPTVGPEAEAPVETDVASQEREPRPAAGADRRSEPTFTSPAPVRSRPIRRPKGRPIYIEPEPEEGDGTARAVND